MARARKIERFLSQPFSSWPKCSPARRASWSNLEDTIKGFKGLVGRRIRPPSGIGFLTWSGTIEDAVEKGKKLAAGSS